MDMMELKELKELRDLKAERLDVYMEHEVACKTRENSNFLKNGKMVISVKI